VSDKVLVCRCEDVTLHEVEQALARGHRDVESLKRYTGFGTGICQGKSCLVTCARLVAEAGATVPVAPMTPRPPLRPLPLSHFARLLDDEPEEES
jgi:bacterioferritin-associated ferredoxin